MGFAESYRGTDDGSTSTLAGAVVRADRTVDDFVFGTCTVGGHDSTAAIVDCWQRLDRPDVQYLLVAGVAPAWYNILDLQTLAAESDRPVLAITFEESTGLVDAIESAFDGTKRRARLDAYHALPERRRHAVDGETLFVRSVGIDDETAGRVLEAFTDERRPEPLRVAKRAARRVDAFRRGDGFRRD